MRLFSAALYIIKCSDVLCTSHQQFAKCLLDVIFDYFSPMAAAVMAQFYGY